MKGIGWAMLALCSTLPAAAQTKPSHPQGERRGEHVATPAAPYAQWLVNQTVAAHPEVKSVELAIVLNGVCRTIAATAAEDVGERCDDDETGPMHTGDPDIEPPSAADPVYDITQPLHDDRGRLIGAVGMDIAPGNLDAAGALRVARIVAGEIESHIKSTWQLLQAAP
jgi:hypothetical protein